MKNVALYVAIALMCLLILYSFVDMQTKSLEGMSEIKLDSSTTGDRQRNNGGRRSNNGGRSSTKVPKVPKYAMPDISSPQFNDTRPSKRVKVPNVEKYVMSDISIPQIPSNTPYDEETINQDYNQTPSLQVVPAPVPVPVPVPVPDRIESTIKPVLSNSDLEFQPYTPYIKTNGETSFSANPVYGPKKKGIKKVLADSVPKEYKEYSSMENNPLYLSTVNSANISVLKRQFDDVLAFKSNLEKTNERIDSIKTRIDDISGGMNLTSNKI